MKRLLIVIALVLVFSACGENGQPKTDSTKAIEITTEKVTEETAIGTTDDGWSEIYKP